MKIAILYDVLGRDGAAWRTGGIQSYVRHLTELCLDAGWDAKIFQPAARKLDTIIGRLPICGVATLRTPVTCQEWARSVLPAVRDWAKGEPLIVIFGQVDMAVPVPGAITIGIQHGVYWDLDTAKPQTPWPVDPCEPNPAPGMVRQIAGKLWRRSLPGKWRTEAHAFRRLIGYAKSYEEVDVRVCVDHNFPNWQRAVVRKRSDKPEYVIINPAEIATVEQLEERDREGQVIRIIFARRFFWYRGTGIMATAGKRLLVSHANTRITFAGEGPDGDLLKKYFLDEARVQFVSYRPEETLQTHLAHDVAVNASLGSEGSSLSVGEAMGAGCAVVATNVGGVTNMILDGYNGLLVHPNAEALYQGLLRVVSHADLRARLGQRAWQTASATFSLDNWRRQWREVILKSAVRL